MCGPMRQATAESVLATSTVAAACLPAVFGRCNFPSAQAGEPILLALERRTGVMPSRALCRCLLLVMALACVTPGWACNTPTRPVGNDAYVDIHLAEVVGIRLTDYTQVRLAQIRDHSSQGWSSDLSPAYELDLLPIETFKGSTLSQITVKVQRGCGIAAPDLKLFGIFYLDKDGNALPIYQDDSEYRDRLVMLRSRFISTCTTGDERGLPHPCWKPRGAVIECLGRVREAARRVNDACPGAGSELYDDVSSTALGRYDWKMPPLPAK